MLQIIATIQIKNINAPPITIVNPIKITEMIRLELSKSMDPADSDLLVGVGLKPPADLRVNTWMSLARAMAWGCSIMIEEV